MKNTLKSISYFLLFLTLFFIDRLIKLEVLSSLKKNDIILFDGLKLTLVWNRGVSFSLFSSQSNLIFSIITFIVAIIIFLFVIHTVIELRSNENIFFEVLVLAGAISNLFDRIFYKGVIDFIDFYIGNWHWPTFNVSDVFIVVGVIGIFGRLVHHGYFSKN